MGIYHPPFLDVQHLYFLPTFGKYPESPVAWMKSLLPSMAVLYVADSVEAGRGHMTLVPTDPKLPPQTSNYELVSGGSVVTPSRVPGGMQQQQERMLCQPVFGDGYRSVLTGFTV